MLRRLLSKPAWLVKKDDLHAELRDRLHAFYAPTTQGGSFTEERLLFYKHLDEWFVRPALCSGIRIKGLKSIFYARYYTMHELASQQSFHVQPFELCPPDKHFLACVDQALINNDHGCDMAVYERAVRAHIQVPGEAEHYLDLESRIFVRLRSDEDLRHRFNALNRDTVHYAKESLQSDYRRLAPVRERIAPHIELLTVVIGVACLLELLMDIKEQL